MFVSNTSLRILGFCGLRVGLLRTRVNTIPAHGFYGLRIGFCGLRIGLLMTRINTIPAHGLNGLRIRLALHSHWISIGLASD